MPNQFALENGGGDWWSQQAGRMQTQSSPQTALPGGTSGSPVGPNTAPPGALPYPGAPATPTITPGQYQNPGPQGGDVQTWFNSLFQNRPFNQETLRGLEPLLNHYGIKLTPPNASGDQTKIQLPDGTWVRVGFGEGHPVWVPQSNAGAGGVGGAGTYSGPGAIPPPFQAPSAADLQNEPGYQARMQMGQQALERSAAAQGSLLSGGTQKSLNRYAQDYASGEYGAAYDRAFRKYQENFLTQSQDPWNRYRDLYAGGLSAGQSTKTATPVTGY